MHSVQEKQVLADSRDFSLRYRSLEVYGYTSLLADIGLFLVVGDYE